MADTHTVDRATLEQLLARIPGVQQVRYGPVAAGVLPDLCVEIAPDSNALQIIEGARALLAAQRQHARSEPVIWLVPAPLQPAVDVRVQLRELIHTRGEPIVTVTLAFNGRRVVGIGRGGGDAPASLEAVAGAATVQALNRLINPVTKIHFDHVQRTQLGQLDLCLVQITLVVDDAPQTAIGVSRIQHDGAEAAARAVLDATNRHLARLALIPR